MGKIGYQKLIAFQKAEEFVVEVYRLATTLPQDESFGMISQIKRAAISVPANIAEGYRRLGQKEKVRFYNIAQGSLVEVECFLGLAIKLGYLAGKNAVKAYELKNEVGKTLYGLIRAIRNDLVPADRSQRTVE